MSWFKKGDEQKTVMKIAGQDVFSMCRKSRLNFVTMEVSLDSTYNKP